MQFSVGLGVLGFGVGIGNQFTELGEMEFFGGAIRSGEGASSGLSGLDSLRVRTVPPRVPGVLGGCVRGCCVRGWLCEAFQQSPPQGSLGVLAEREPCVGRQQPHSEWTPDPVPGIVWRSAPSIARCLPWSFRSRADLPARCASSTLWPLLPPSPISLPVRLQRALTRSPVARALSPSPILFLTLARLGSGSPSGIRCFPSTAMSLASSSAVISLPLARPAPASPLRWCSPWCVRSLRPRPIG